MSGVNTAGVAADLQLLSFGGRDAGDATAVSYKIGSNYHFATLYDGLLGLGECSLSSEDTSTRVDNSISCHSGVYGRLYIWTAAEDMGTLQLTGPGYTGAVANADYSNVNAGSLIYDCTTGNHLKWYCGYGAHVRLDDTGTGDTGTYDVSGLTSSSQGVKFVLRKLDREVATGGITLNICVGANCGTCELIAQDSREPWYGHNGVHANAASNACDTLYESLR